MKQSFTKTQADVKHELNTSGNLLDGMKTNLLKWAHQMDARQEHSKQVAGTTCDSELGHLLRLVTFPAGKIANNCQHWELSENIQHPPPLIK